MEHPELRPSVLSSISRLALFGLAWVVFGCEAPPSPGEACNLAQDQWNSFMPAMYWESERAASGDAVEVTIDEDFSEGKFGQQGAIERGIQVWNDFSAQSLNAKLFRSRVGFVHADTGPKSKNDLGCENFIGGSDNRFSIVRVKDEARWKALEYTASVPAATARCYDGGKLKKQAILVNVNHVNPTQLTGIIIHELGHAIGLKHSCNEDEKKDDPYYISCSKVAENEFHPYRVAVMFPVFGASERKQTLRKNDMWRAYCQYQDK